MPELELKVLIVDDEPLARRGLVRLVEAHAGVQVTRTCSNGRQAVLALIEERFDLVLLDVEMPELDGFGVLAEVGPAALPHVVFVTAFDRYAVRAFEAHALDYVVKPVEPARLAQTFARVRDLSRKAASEARLAGLLFELDERARRPNHLIARSGGRTRLVPVERIDWLQAAGNYVRLHLCDETVLQRETLAHLHERLDPALFVRVHRSHAVNLTRVSEIRPTGRGDAELLLVGGASLPVARGLRAQLERALGDLSESKLRTPNEQDN